MSIGKNDDDDNDDDREDHDKQANDGVIFQNCCDFDEAFLQGKSGGENRLPKRRGFRYQEASLVPSKLYYDAETPGALACRIGELFHWDSDNSITSSQLG